MKFILAKVVLPNPNGLLFMPSSPLLLPIPPKEVRMDLIPGSDGETLDVLGLPEFPEVSVEFGWFGLFISAFKSEKLSDVFILVNDDRLLKLIEPLII